MNHLLSEKEILKLFNQKEKVVVELSVEFHKKTKIKGLNSA